MTTLTTQEKVFAKAKESLTERILLLDIESLEISDYSKEYLRFYLTDIQETLGRFEQLILTALVRTKKSVSELTMVDYGGGVGLLALLAKEVGFKSVVYNDIFQRSCEDVQVLASACSLRLDHIVQGDAPELVRAISEIGIRVDIVVSNDVIEHVYSVEENFRTFSQLVPSPLGIVYGSTANERHILYSRRLKKEHKRVEDSDRKPFLGHKPSDDLQSYSNLRRHIILRANPLLSSEQLEFLVRQTRGLNKADIEGQILQHKETGALSYQPKHPTNTCDPLSGNWCEQLLNFTWLTSCAQSTGFNAEVLKGSYSTSATSRSRLQRTVLNTLIYLLGSFGFSVAPYYILILTPRE